MSENIPLQNSEFSFLQGGGEMGQLIRSLNWSDNPLGDPSSWPIALKQTISMMLTTAFPVLICWGKNYIQLYNDAFRPINGESKHPRAMGGSAKDTYTEIWDQIGPMFQSVIEGQTVGFPNFMVPLDRNGYVEDCYFDFSYSPIRDENGNIGGILVICVETTAKLNAIKQAELAKSEVANQRDRLSSFFMQAPAGICILNGPELTYELVNPAYQRLLPGRALINRPIFEALPELAGTPLQDVLLNVYRTGESFDINELLIPVAEYEGGPTHDRYFTFNYQARRDREGKIDGILVFVFEVTSMTKIQQDQLTMNEELMATNEESAALNEKLYVSNEELLATQHELQRQTDEKQLVIVKLQAAEENIRNMVRQAPVGMCIVKGSPLMVEEINDLFLEIIGKERKMFKTVPYWEVNAEAAFHYKWITDHVLISGETYHANEREIILVRQGKEKILHVDFVYEPIRDSSGKVEAIMIVAIDVTDKVNTRKTVEAHAAEFQLLSEKLAEVNEEYLTTNEELTATNEELASVNDELYASNEELIKTQEHLRDTNLALGESESRLKAAFESIARSEKLFKSIALNIPKSLIIVIGKDHRYITVEGEIMEQLGYDRKDYEGKHPLEVAPPERYEATRELYDRVLSGETFSVERKAVTGEHLMVHFIPLKDDKNEVDTGLIIAFDITEIKQAEEKSAKLAAIIESSDDAIIGKTLKSVITSWNNSAERMFGYTADEIIGQTIYTLIPADRQNEEPRILARLKKGERVEHFETKRVTKDGRELDVSLTISPIRDSKGFIIGVSKIIRDITERKQDETRKSDFIGMVSHELKTPLTSLTAIVQMVRQKLKNNEDEFLAGAMEKANTQVKRMGTMINGFLNISRLESGKIHIDKQQFNINKLLNEMVEETKLTVNTHDISLYSCGELKIYADRDKIGSVISNLISNAVKYSPKGKMVQLSCEIMEGEAMIGVKDEGMGIKPADIKHVFDRYYRVQTNHTRHISGFGIGLYLSAEIIKRHDGRIWVESESGKGSTFWFTLPLS